MLMMVPEVHTLSEGHVCAKSSPGTWPKDIEMGRTLSIEGELGSRG